MSEPRKSHLLRDGTLEGMWVVGLEGYVEGDETPCMSMPVLARRVSIDDDIFVLCRYAAPNWFDGRVATYYDGDRVKPVPGQRFAVGEGTWIDPEPARPDWGFAIYGPRERPFADALMPNDEAHTTRIGDCFARHAPMRDCSRLRRAVADEARRQVQTEPDVQKRADAAWWLTRASNNRDDALLAALALVAAEDPEYDVPLQLAASLSTMDERPWSRTSARAMVVQVNHDTACIFTRKFGLATLRMSADVASTLRAHVAERSRVPVDLELAYCVHLGRVDGEIRAVFPLSDEDPTTAWREWFASIGTPQAELDLLDSY